MALTNLGQQQAALTASAVVGASEVVCSPLLRARQTAGVLGPSTDIRIDDRWTEIDYGEYDGWPMSEGPAPPWEIWRADPEYTPPGGESLAACGRRVRSACEELAERASDLDIVVVSHVSPIKAAVIWSLGVEDQMVTARMFLDVASVCRITVGPQGTSLHTYNDTHHLSSLVR